MIRVVDEEVRRIRAERAWVMAAYKDDLRERVCRVRCPYCGASVGEWCIGQYSRRTKGFHAARSDAAKRAGHVMGRGGCRPAATDRA